MKRIKRIFCLVLILCLNVCCLSVPAGAASTFTGLQPVQTYLQGQFTDVSAASWYAGSVAAVYELGLMQGDDDTFSPEEELTIAESLALVCRLHSLLNGGDGTFAESSPWYQSCVEYALQQGLLEYAYTDYTVPATRAEFAQMLSAALPDSAAEAVNTVDDGAISDVPMSAAWAQDVYRLYRAGILTGSSITGRFRPGETVTRAEAAAILARAADPDSRVSLTLLSSSGGTELQASEIYQLCSPGVFYIAVLDEAGSVISSGSGFFLDSDGLAVTNYHVIESGTSAQITTADGAVYEVLGVYGYDPETDLAILQVDGDGFSALTLSTGGVSSGDTVYAIGAPLGLTGTISDGIVSSPSRTYAGITYIQTTASISSGSSGGALLNAWGEVIGITTASLMATSGVSQNINLALPVSCLDEVEVGELRTLAEITAAESAETADPETGEVSFYAGGAPDYGSVTGAECLSSWFRSENRTEDGYVEGADRYFYPWDISAAADYMRWLLDNGYALSDSAELEYGTLLIYSMETEDGTVSAGICCAEDFSGIYIFDCPQADA